ncbi:thiol reductant ABC exporter subunit CydC [Lactobacillus sanfranciscensis]|nr:thiol reductant ABC exporter subunit CydC [Fructilactobacillus sanfranciscensis]NDR75643.1 thiol reductant ABC exporter subunit CydC [Fructilactobacillus sanfranciscensis]NDR96401.1 thiol reductant ABC exporter subunit CydC [Fructilactobacillus sanfranciscensis]NDS04178.1 thiol reductant ABC exporter subunit CydC [Fructilactobacillus sanfranciscensis]POH19232.1 thiol reductant ABC exporter subunit CydC [Fructilactobacillus sanfranciscensis]POH22262.1 thiol reductant ABC exporter subunit Cyd
MHKIFKNDTWIKPYLARYKKLLVLVFFLGVLTFFCAIGLMFVAGYLISRSATHPYNILVVYVPVLLTRAFGIGRPLFKYLERINSHNWVLKVTSLLRKRLYTTLETSAMFLTSKFQTGDLLSILAEDIDHLENLYLRTIFPTVVAYITGIIVILCLGVISWLYAIFMLISFAIILLFIPLASVAMRGAAKEYERSLVHESYSELTDATFGIDDWMISGRKNGFLKRVTKNDSKLDASNFRTRKYEWNRDLLVKVMFAIILIGTLIWSNCFFNSSQALANYAAAFVLGVFPLMDTFIPVSQAMEEWPMYKDSVLRLNKLSNDEIKPSPDQSATNPDTFKEIKMNDVTFNYPGESVSLIKNVSLEVKRGQKLAIIGPSGVGKTTLLQLLLGSLIPTKGSVTIDGINVTRLQNNQAKWFSVLDQHPFLFNTSVLNNVRIGNENASNEDVKQAIKDVGLEDYIKSLPDGYNTNVRESGVRFSGGQRQRLALARILLQNNPIVLLDEPTVGLDPITENDLIKTLDRVLKGKTVIWVTHHLQGLSNMNQVIFLENGSIKMEGTPSELYKNNPRYRKLYAMDQGIVQD